jgi:hypothetical protein
LTGLLPSNKAIAYANVPWVINGNAQRSITGRVILTQNSTSQAGSMWNPCAISMGSNWSYSFAMNFGANACGADGIDFVLQAQGTGALGPTSGEHAYSTSIGQSIAVVFDTWSNMVSPYWDPPYDSLALQTNASQANVACTGGITGNCGRPRISATQFNIKDGLDHAVTIAWDASSYALSVTVDGSLQAQYIFSAAIISSIFGANPVYYGFTASTGGG